MPRKTIERVKAKNIAFSLRNFLKSQKRQLTFQADKQMMFERLLPYAVTFGVEKIWAKRFENLGIKQPDWYGGFLNWWYFVLRSVFPGRIELPSEVPQTPILSIKLREL